MHETGLVRNQWIRGIALVVVTTAMLGSTAAVAETVTDHDRHPRKTAEEVCESMVRDSVIAAAGRKLARPRTGVWNGNTYTCTYDFGAQGSIVVTVEVMADHAAAQGIRDPSGGGAQAGDALRHGPGGVPVGADADRRPQGPLPAHRRRQCPHPGSTPVGHHVVDNARGVRLLVADCDC